MVRHGVSQPGAQGHAGCPSHVSWALDCSRLLVHFLHPLLLVSLLLLWPFWEGLLFFCRNHKPFLWIKLPSPTPTPSRLVCMTLQGAPLTSCPCLCQHFPHCTAIWLPMQFTHLSEDLIPCPRSQPPGGFTEWQCLHLRLGMKFTDIFLKIVQVMLMQGQGWELHFSP